MKVVRRGSAATAREQLGEHQRQRLRVRGDLHAPDTLHPARLGEREVADVLVGEAGEVGRDFILRRRVHARRAAGAGDAHAVGVVTQLVAAHRARRPERERLDRARQILGLP